MRLKILLVPFLIILVLVLAIGFIRPEILVTQAQRLEIEMKKSQVDSIGIILNNVGSLSSSLDNAKDTELFVQNYLPTSMDQERVIDALNFSALQSGVLVEKIEVLQPAEPTVLTQINAEGTEVPIVEVNPDGTPIVPAVTPKNFSTKITVKGSYENIKNFISRSARMDRFYTLKEFSVGLSERDLTNEIVDTANGLQGTFYADYQYLKTQQNNSVLNSEIFTKSAIDVSVLQPTIDWTTNKVPLLEKPTTGKPNPFQ